MVRSGVNIINLHGDLSLVGVRDQYSILKQYFAEMGADSTTGNGLAEAVDIDLSEVQTLDACGCQLLAVFIRKLRQFGVEEVVLKMSDVLREKIHGLGFDNELVAGDKV